MKRLPVILLIAIPAAAVLMGAVSLYLALQGPDQEIPLLQAPLNKTSWQHPEDAGRTADVEETR